MRAFLLIFAALFPCLAAMAAEPKELLEALPAELAECQREPVHLYKEPGLGASTAYRTQNLLFTVYAYDLGKEKIAPGIADPIVQKAFEMAMDDINTAKQAGYYSDVVKGDSGAAKMGGSREVLRAKYRLTRNRGADAGNKFISEIFVFGAKDKIIKVRVTATADEEAKHTKVIEKFVPALFDQFQK